MGESRDAIFNACLEKYACGMISPKNVMRNVENIKADTPAITDFDNRVSKTLMPTFPHRIVTSRKLESSLRLNTLTADLFLLAASISNLNLGMLKNARFSPEKIADCVIQKPIATQRRMFEVEAISMVRKFLSGF
jgi:hypothetical protein